MKKILLTIVLIGIFGAYIVVKRLGLGPDEQAANSVKIVPKPTPTTDTTTVPQPKSSYRDGQYTSPVADATYGPLQISVTISGGKISDVVFLQSPSDRSTSVRINSQAMPLLRQETITAQSANIDGVSGATATSDAFIQSLTNVLSQAM